MRRTAEGAELACARIPSHDTSKPSTASVIARVCSDPCALPPAFILLSPLSHSLENKNENEIACGFSSAITLTGMDRDEGQGECVREESMVAWSCSKALVHSQMLTRATCADVRVPARRLRSHEHRLRRPEAGA